MLLFWGLFSFYSCDPTNEAAAPATPNQQELLRLVNEARTAGCNCGGVAYPAVPAVTWNALLENAAQGHSDHMSTTKHLSHTGSNGSSAGDRITAAGYNWTIYTENIASGYTSEEDVIQGWLASPGHCQNIMNANVTEMGVATADSYWTQVFAGQ